MSTEEAVKGRPMQELRRLLAEDNARWDELAEAWPNLSVAEQVELVRAAKEKVEASS